MSGAGPTSFIERADDIKPYEGKLEIRSVDRKGRVLTSWKTPNVITFDARVIMAHLLVGDQVPTYKIGFIGVGTGNNAPQRSDTTLVAEVHQQAIEPFNFPAAGQVEITATLDFTSPANGNTLKEAGLISLDGTTLFARQVHGDIFKDSGIQLQYIWRIIFT